MTSSFFGFTTTRPVAILMVLAATVVFGFVGLARLPVNLLPDLSYPTVTIRTVYEGASPQDVEERISERIQESVSVVPGVRRALSVSRPGVSDVILEFAWGTKMVFAVSDIRERLDRVFLPAEAERPVVLRYDPNLDPVITLGLSGEQSLVELRRIADEELKIELEKIDGIAAVKVRGGDEEEIRILVDEAALASYGLDVGTLGQRLRAENLNAASGTIEEGNTEFLVRALGEFRNLVEIEDVIVDRRGEVSVRLRDVARVVRTARDREVISRVDGVPCVLVDVYRAAGANVVALCAATRTRMFGTERQRAYVAAGRHLAPFPAAAAGPGGTPDPAVLRAASERRQMTDYLGFQMQRLGVDTTLLQDQSRFIESAVDDVESSALQGGFLAIAIIYLFLRRFSATAILSVSIPVSLIASFAPMYLSDVSINIMSLGGLALGVGMLVDNSIVVLESITKAREDGHAPAQAAVLGTSRVAGAVVASTLTTLAVFFPIVFVEGVAGQLFRDLSLTVVYSLAMSLLVALFVVPMLASRGLGTGGAVERPRTWLGRGVQAAGAALLRLVLVAVAGLGWLLHHALWPLRWAFDRVYGAVDRTYPTLLRGVLRHRFVAIGLGLILLVGALLRAPALGSELIPETHQGELFLDAYLPRDATVERTDAVLAPLERSIAALPEVASTFLAVGVDKKELNDSDQGEHSARILIRLHPARDRPAQEERVRNAIRELVRVRPEIQTYRFAQTGVLSFQAPLVVEILGRDLGALREASVAIEAGLRRIPGLRDVRCTLQRGNPEISIRLDRDKMAALGLDSGVVARILQTKVQGDVPTRFAERERKIDIRVRRDQEELATLDRLLGVNVNPKGTPEIPLGSVAEVKRVEGPSEIRRIGNVRGAEVQAARATLDLGGVQRGVDALLYGLDLPAGIDARLGGQKEEMERSRDSLNLALVLAIFLVYIVMASQFESLIQPLVILASLPLALVGVVFTLDVLGVPVSVMVLLGGIVLAGVVVNNAIVLIDQVNQLRRAGLGKAEAIVQGAHGRLRPVLMTTLTTLLGLLPMTGWLADLPLVGGLPEGLELRAPMAITLIAGLASSTLLTLLVIPAVYSFADRRV
ncbi:MAG: efflux RND transporter permease subunit [Planctomycetes bacterium]|nr:efflux RND transporter permease subunit [Planctomycetota bacterium]